MMEPIPGVSAPIPFGLVPALEGAGLLVRIVGSAVLCSDAAAGQAIAAAHDPLAAARVHQLDALAERRWQQESQGILRDGISIDTSRDARRNVDGAILQSRIAAEQGTAYQVRWKTPTGAFVDLNGASLIAAGQAIDAYVRACFAREAALAADVMAATTWQAVLAVDITAGWPS
jgi:hypothetical protein